MGLTDKLKDLRTKAEDAVVEHKDQIQQTVQKVGAAADQRTGGKYSEKIQQAEAKASGLVEGLGEDSRPAADEPATEGESQPPAA
jgi:hypothetical protein